MLRDCRFNLESGAARTQFVGTCDSSHSECGEVS